LEIKNNPQEMVNSIISEVSKVVVGKNNIKRLLLAALLGQGHVLIEGLPGTGKTTIARTFAQAIGGEFKRIQGTPDMLPADMLGFYLYRPDGSSQFMPGPIFANVVLVDELNRLTPRSQSALLESMQELQVTIERETHPLGEPFLVIGAQLPRGGAGTSALTEVQADRFMFRVWSGFPEIEEENMVLGNIDEILTPHISPAVSPNDILGLQEQVRAVHVADSIRGYIIEICNRLRQHTDLTLGPSPRGSIALLRGARAIAFMDGRDFVIPDDVKELAVPALHHRLRISAEAEMDNATPEDIIEKVLSEVPVPTV
jgi:MoxR-like ATPase